MRRLQLSEATENREMEWPKLIETGSLCSLKKALFELGQCLQIKIALLLVSLTSKVLQIKSFMLFVFKFDTPEGPGTQLGSIHSKIVAK